MLQAVFSSGPFWGQARFGSRSPCDRGPNPSQMPRHPHGRQVDVLDGDVQLAGVHLGHAPLKEPRTRELFAFGGLHGARRGTSGDRSWGQVRWFRRRLTTLPKGGCLAKIGQFAGNRVLSALRIERPARLATSMVRRGSTVRVRQRALQKPSTSGLLRSGRLACR